MKREQLIQELRKIARSKGVRFEVHEGKGKGSHYLIVFGDNVTTLKSGEMKPGYVSLIKKQLGIK